MNRLTAKRLTASATATTAVAPTGVAVQAGGNRATVRFMRHDDGISPVQDFHLRVVNDCTVMRGLALHRQIAIGRFVLQIRDTEAGLTAGDTPNVASNKG